MAQFFFSNNNLLLGLTSVDLPAPVLQSPTAPTFTGTTGLASFSITFAAYAAYQPTVTHYLIEEARWLSSLSSSPFPGFFALAWQQVAVVAVADLPVDGRVNVTHTLTNRQAVSQENGFGFDNDALYPNNVYYYRVRAVTPKGTTPYSNITSIHLVFEAPNAPRNLAVYPGHRSVLLTWQAPTETPNNLPVFRYDIEVSKNRGALVLGTTETYSVFTEFTLRPWLLSTFVFEPLDEGVERTFRVRALYLDNMLGQIYLSEWSGRAWTTPQFPQVTSADPAIVCDPESATPCATVTRGDLPKFAIYNPPPTSPLGVSSWPGGSCASFCTNSFSDVVHIDIVIKSDAYQLFDEVEFLKQFVNLNFSDTELGRASFGISSKNLTSKIPAMRPWHAPPPPTEAISRAAPVAILDFGLRSADEFMAPLFYSMGFVADGVFYVHGPQNYGGLPAGVSVSSGVVEKLGNALNNSGLIKTNVFGDLVRADNGAKLTANTTVSLLQCFSISIDMAQIKETYNKTDLTLKLYGALVPGTFGSTPFKTKQQSDDDPELEPLFEFDEPAVTSYTKILSGKDWRKAQESGGAGSYFFDTYFSRFSGGGSLPTIECNVSRQINGRFVVGSRRTVLTSNGFVNINGSGPPISSIYAANNGALQPIPYQKTSHAVTLPYKHYDNVEIGGVPRSASYEYDLSTCRIAQIDVQKYGSVTLRPTTPSSLLPLICPADPFERPAAPPGWRNVEIRNIYRPTIFLETRGGVNGGAQSVYNDDVEVAACGCDLDKEPPCVPIGSAGPHASIASIPAVQKWCLRQRNPQCVAASKQLLVGGGAAWKYILNDEALASILSLHPGQTASGDWMHLLAQSNKTFVFFEAQLPGSVFSTGFVDAPMRVVGIDALPVKPTQMRLELIGLHEFVADLRLVLKGPDGRVVFQTNSFIGAGDGVFAGQPIRTNLQRDNGFSYPPDMRATDWYGSLVLALHTAVLPLDYEFDGIWTVSIYDSHHEDDLTLHVCRLGFITDSAPWIVRAPPVPPPPGPLPGRPTIVTATPDENQVTLTWNEPSSTGAAAITKYVVQFAPRDPRYFSSRLGESVSLNAAGDICAVGAPNSGSNNRPASGCVQVYRWDDTNWTKLGADIVGKTVGDKFGHRVSLNAAGTIVAVGAPQTNDNVYRGCVRVYRWNDVDWEQMGADIDGVTDTDQSGSGLSLNAAGDVVAIGSPIHSPGINNVGQVRVFAWDGTAWVQRGDDITGATENTTLGFSVSLNAAGDVLAVGAPWHDDHRGFACVYSWDGFSWNKIGANIHGETPDEETGFSVSLNAAGNVLAVGAPYFGVGRSVGQARVYALNTNNTAWVQRGDDVVFAPEPGRHGTSVSLNAAGDIIAVGAPGYTRMLPALYAGRVQVYRWTGSIWALRGNAIDGTEVSNVYGSSVSLNAAGDVVAAGGPGYSANGSFSGQALIYSLVNANWIKRGRNIEVAPAWTTFYDGTDNTDRVAVISELLSGTTYSFRVAAENAAGMGPYSAQLAATLSGIFAPPPPPVDLVATPGDARVTLSWSPPQDTGNAPITDYLIHFSANGGATWQPAQKSVSATPSATIIDLTNDVPYLFRIAAVNSDGAGVFSATIAATPGISPFDVSSFSPTIVSFIVGVDQVVFSFVPPASTNNLYIDGVVSNLPITSYAVTYSTDGATWLPGPTPTIFTRSFTLSGLVPNTDYSVRIAPVHSEQQQGGPPVITTGEPSDVVVVRPTALPARPTNLVATPGAAQVTLSWTAPAANNAPAVTDYIIQYSVAGLFWTTVQDGGGTATTTTITDLIDGAALFFRVAAVNSNGAGPFTAAVVAAPGPVTVPSPPHLLTGVTGNGQIVLSWQPPTHNNGAEITGYIVQRSSDAGRSWASVFESTSPVTTSGPIAGFNGTPYVFRVAAVNSAGIGIFSARFAVTFVTERPGVVLAPALVYSPTGGMRFYFAPPAAPPEDPLNKQIRAYRVVVFENNLPSPGSPFDLAVTDPVLADQWPPPDTEDATFAGLYSLPQFPTLSAGSSYAISVGTLNAFNDAPGTNPGNSSLLQSLTVSAVAAPAAPVLAEIVQKTDDTVEMRVEVPPTADLPKITALVLEWTASQWVGTINRLEKAINSPSLTFTPEFPAGVRVFYRLSWKLNASQFSANSYSEFKTGNFVKETPPGPPLNLTAAPGDAQVTLFWAPPATTGGAPLNDYLVSYSIDGGVTWAEAPIRVPATAKSYTVTGLLNGAAYWFSMLANNRRGSSAWATVAVSLSDG